ncbi:MAG: hypothetical protein GX927_12355 [Lentisphaerae bacterium]|nr:hypothetical protein [Lentisphaerota bacterium]
MKTKKILLGAAALAFTGILNAETIMSANFDKSDALLLKGGRSVPAKINGTGIMLRNQGTVNGWLEQQNQGTTKFIGGNLSWSIPSFPIQDGGFSAWFKPEGLGVYNVFFGLGGQIWNKSGVLSLFYDTEAQQLYLRMRSATGQSGDAVLKVNLAPHEWCQVAASWQYDEQNQKMILHAGCRQPGGNWLTAEGMTAWDDKSLNEKALFGVPLTLWFGSGPQGRNPACGLLDDMKIYDKAISFDSISGSVPREKSGAVGISESTFIKLPDIEPEGNNWRVGLIPVPHLKEIPVIDGRGKAWHRDLSLVPVMLTPGSMCGPDVVSQAHLGMIDDQLYVFVHNEVPSTNAMVCETMEHDGHVYNNECTELYLVTPDGDCYQWIIDPRGQSFDARNRDKGYDGKIKMAAAIENNGWNAEFLIPADQLNAKKLLGCRINIARNHTAHVPSQLSQLIVSKRDNFSDLDNFSWIYPLQSSSGIALTPGIAGGPAGQPMLNVALRLPGNLSSCQTRLIIREPAEGAIIDKRESDSPNPTVDLEIKADMSALLVQAAVECGGSLIANLFYPVASGPSTTQTKTSLQNPQAKTAFFLNHQLGMSPGVPAPFKPIQFDGRQLTFLNSRILCGEKLFEQLSGNGADLLAAPMRLMAGNSEISVGGIENVMQNAETIQFTRPLSVKGKEGKLAVKAEYDGMIYVSIDLPSVPMENLKLEIPINSEWVKFIELSGAQDYAGNGQLIIPENEKRYGFRSMPRIVIGGRSHSLAFATEHPGRWKNQNMTRVLEYYRDGKGVDTLTLNFSDMPLGTAAEQFDFAFLVMPVKPASNFSVDRDAAWVNVYYPQRLLTPMECAVDGKETPLDLFKRCGVKTVVFFDHWMKYQSGHTPAFEPSLFKEIIKACKAAGLRVILYRSRELSNASPFWNDFSASSLTIPSSYGFKRTYPLKQTSYGYCPASQLSDYFLWSADFLLKEYGVDGFYLDGAANDLLCSNSAHGCGENGKATFGIRANRAMMKRLWKLFSQHQKEPLIDAHGFSPFAIGFLTSGYAGEQFWKMRRFDAAPHKIIPPHLMRPLFDSVQNKGIRTMMLFYDGCPFTPEEVSAMALVNGIMPRPHSVEQLPGMQALKTVAPIWAAMRQFNTDGGKWHLWSEENRFRMLVRPQLPGGNEQIKLSVVEQSDRNLYFLANYGIFAVSASISDPERKVIADAVDLLSGNPVAHDAKQVRVIVPPYQLQIIQVKFDLTEKQ